jgi:protocatechuate 3,4-dioxygenase beta subunit
VNTGRPITRARVVVSGPGTGGVALTDEAGRYEISRLAPGTIAITAAKGGFLATSYGQASWPGAGTSLTLRERERLEGIEIRMPRGGVVAGQVFDDTGEPLASATVRATRVIWVNGESRAASTASDTTDDRGQYRVFGLTPGTYYVSATARSDSGGALPGEADQGGQGGVSMPVGYAPTYYPAAISVADATAVGVKAGQETLGIDVTTRLVSMAKVSGVVTSSEPSARMSVTLFAEGQGGFPSPGLQAAVSRDGTFTVRNVPPGRYIALAHEIRVDPVQQRTALATLRFAALPLLVSGQDITGVTMTLRPGGTISGTVSFEGSRAQPPRNLGSFRVMATGLRASIGIPASVSSVRADGSFTINNVAPLPVMLDAAVPARDADAGADRRAPWQLKGIYLNGRDISDAPIEVSPDRPVSGVVVVFSDSVTTLAGAVRDNAGQPAAGCAVVVFSSDRALWSLPLSRYVRMARTGRDGRFEIRPLAPGSYYVQTLADVDSLQWSNPEVLEQLRETASLVRVVDGETKSLDLLLRGR